VTLDDVLANTPSQQRGAEPLPGAEPLRGARRVMAQSMTASRDQVSGSTVCDDADVHAWVHRGDYMPRLMRALVSAWRIEPSLNAWFHARSESRTLFDHIDLAIAVDTPGGLIVPVVRNIGARPRMKCAPHWAEQSRRLTLSAPGLRDYAAFT